MNKGFMVLITLVLEAVLLWLFSIIFEWTFIDTIFLGGLFILGVAWFIYFIPTPRHYEYDRSVENKKTETIISFLFVTSPITWGISLFAVGSSLITFFTYYPFN